MSGKSAEASMLSPSPRPLSRSILSPASCVATDELLHAERPFWYDGPEEDLESQEVFLGQAGDQLVLPKCLPAFNVCRASEASTSAGPSPRLETSLSSIHFSSPSISPERPSTPQVDDENSMAISLISLLSIDSPSSSQKAPHMQSRKVFVGGIPQRVDTNDLHKIFSKFGEVKKAWLQVFTGELEHDGKHHRGFGFVIFTDSQTVDKLLGEEFSKFVYCGDGLSVEVKRAIGKNNLSTLSPGSSPTVIGHPCEAQRCGASAVALRRAQPKTPISLAGAIADSFPCANRQPTPAQHQCFFNTQWVASPPVFPFQVGGFTQEGLVTQAPAPNMHWQCQKNLELLLRKAMPDSYED